MLLDELEETCRQIVFLASSDAVGDVSLDDQEVRRWD